MNQAYSFFGAGKTRAQYALLELATIPEEDRIEEPELVRKRWFDVGGMMPSEATYLFAHTFCQVVREHFSKTVDYRTAGDLTPLPEDVFKSPELISVWRARQAADRIGCRYDFYIRTFFNRALDRGWHSIPRPNHLYAEEVVLDIRDAWEAAKLAYLQTPTDPFFSAHQYVGHPRQVAYLEYVAGFIKTREQPHLVLWSLVSNGGFPKRCLEDYFSPDLLRRVSLL